ncbi:hypothetical protein JTB14_004428 [Gonioctena quinquepunctata]|nr:hypothetical protein JTB14_004428 [Gonioctena quinquepunctata]
MSKRGSYGRWTEQEMSMAIGAYRAGEAGLNKCRRYNISKSTLLRHLRGTNKLAEENVKKMGTKCVFSTVTENTLVKIIQFEEMLYGFTIIDIRRLALQLAEKHNLPHRFDREKKTAAYNIAELLGRAYGKASSVGVSESALRGAGVWPLNRNKFADYSFAAATAVETHFTEQEKVDDGSAGSTLQAISIENSTAAENSSIYSIVTKTPNNTDKVPGEITPDKLNQSLNESALSLEQVELFSDDKLKLLRPQLSSLVHHTKKTLEEKQRQTNKGNININKMRKAIEESKHKKDNKEQQKNPQERKRKGPPQKKEPGGRSRF